MYELYYFPATCSFAPWVVLEEIGEPYVLHMVTPAEPVAGPVNLDSTGWRKVNPKGRVPALLGVPGRSGGAPQLLTEAAAIMYFLARSHPAARLIPEDIAGEARCLEWTNYLATNVHALIMAQLNRLGRIVDDPACHPQIREKGLRNARESFAYIETIFADDREWALPSGFSIVDPYLALFYRAGGSFGIDMTDYPRWSRQAEATEARPATRRVRAAEARALEDARAGRFSGPLIMRPA